MTREEDLKYLLKTDENLTFISPDQLNSKVEQYISISLEEYKELLKKAAIADYILERERSDCK